MRRPLQVLPSERLPILRRFSVWFRTFKARGLGQAGEIAAEYYLQLKGLVAVESNWRGKEGELDLICVTPGNELVVVEVKTSAVESSGAWEHLDWEKRERVMRTAKLYLYAHKIPPDHPWRVDVVVVEGDPRNLLKPLRFTWVRNAF